MTVHIPGNIPLWPALIPLIIIACALLWKKKPSIWYVVCLLVFAVYIVVVLDKTLLPIEVSGSYADTMRQEPIVSRVNLTPFYFGPFGTLQDAASTLALNIALTIPFGFGLNFVARAKAKKFIWIAPLVGLSIELMQLLISLGVGYAYRYIDVNDVMMNTLGVVIGYGLFRVLAWLYIALTRHFKFQWSSFAAYIYDVAKRA